MINGLSRPLYVVLCVACSSAVSAPTFVGATDMERRVYEYDILRDGSPVGAHTVVEEYHDGETRVLSESLIEIGLLGLVFYRFRYESDESWDQQGLRRLRVWVDDNDERLRIDGYRDADRFHWSVNGADAISQPMPVFPTNHWNAGVLSQDTVLNTLTGGLNQVDIQPQEAPVAHFERFNGAVRNYRYSGELRLDTWYDGSGRWVGMRFEDRHGSTIEYRCGNCNTWRTL